jgi:hypothetical protein
MHKTLCFRSDPQASIAISEYPSWPELSRRNLKWRRIGFSVNKSADSAVPFDQERAVSVFP